VALCLGIIIGTYASIMIGTPVMYDATEAAAARKAAKKNK
jgi:SecD/SecF fusion protein